MALLSVRLSSALLRRRAVETRVARLCRPSDRHRAQRRPHRRHGPGCLTVWSGSRQWRDPHGLGMARLRTRARRRLGAAKDARLKRRRAAHARLGPYDVAASPDRCGMDGGGWRLPANRLCSRPRAGGVRAPLLAAPIDEWRGQDLGRFDRDTEQSCRPTTIYCAGTHATACRWICSSRTTRRSAPATRSIRR